VHAVYAVLCMICAQNVQLISLAVSLGGTGSLIEHPASLTNTESLMDAEARKKCGVADGLVRMR